MNADRAWARLNLTALCALVLGVVGCAVGAAIDVTGFFGAWLCTFSSGSVCHWPELPWCWSMT